uniref:Uncharacterized protein n=1 Tax=Setaria viridis TaxID=4556 RepID=A0A4U6TJA4_SETVI|nr:hypothetical protein SEVIR_8G246864v2 [Setaria viridis]
MGKEKPIDSFFKSKRDEPIVDCRATSGSSQPISPLQFASRSATDPRSSSDPIPRRRTCITEAIFAARQRTASSPITIESYSKDLQATYVYR